MDEHATEQPRSIPKRPIIGIDDTSNRPRTPDGKFGKGGPGPPLGVTRPKGPSKMTREIKQGIIDAAVRVGRDGRGAGGLTGYLEFLAASIPNAFAAYWAGSSHCSSRRRMLNFSGGQRSHREHHGGAFRLLLNPGGHRSGEPAAQRDRGAGPVAQEDDSRPTRTLPPPSRARSWMNPPRTSPTRLPLPSFCVCGHSFHAAACKGPIYACR